MDSLNTSSYIYKKETDGTLEESSRRLIPHKVGYTYEGKSGNWLTQHKTACHTIALLTDLISFLLYL